MGTIIGSKSFHFSLVLVGALAACGPGADNNGGDTGLVINTDSGTEQPDAGMTDGGGDGGTEVDMSMSACGEPTGQRPPQISEHAGVFIPNDEDGSIVMFGGSLGIPENCGFPQRTYETTTWNYDVACDRWNIVETDAMPQGRTRHTMVYDEANEQVVLFGGLGAGGPRNDVWTYDPAEGTWAELQTTGTAPPARLNHTAAYDSTNGRMLVFGGNTGSSVININPANDLWELDLESNTWTDISAPGGPEPRLWVSSLYDPDREQFVVFGGGDDSAFTGNVDYFEDVWSFKGGNWLRLDIGSALRPEGRFWAGWTYDPVNRQYLLFGGHDDTNLGNKNDTWFFDPLGGEWTEHLAGDIPNAPPNGVCDFPADFTQVEEESIERRNAHVFVTGPNTAYAMGGKTDCGVIDDLAGFHFETGTWEVLTRATAGEVCLRRGGGDTCSSLCL